LICEGINFTYLKCCEGEYGESLVKDFIVKLVKHGGVCQMNKTIKKIVALGMGATMLASTIGFALATDLSSYPAPFVQNGVFVGKIVLGETAASIDTLGAIDISTSLQRAATTKVAAAGASTSVSGGFRLDTAGDRMYLGDRPSVDSVTKDNLDVLKDNSFEDNEGTLYGYTQAISIGKGSYGGVLTFSQHSQSSVDSFLAFDTSSATPTLANNFYAAKVDFTKAVNATKAAVLGQKIILFGKEYTFSSESSGNKLVLYGSSEEVSLQGKDSITKTIGGKDYKVDLVGFSSSGTSVTVLVNGDTGSLTQGSSKTIGGLKIYAKSVSSWDGGSAVGTTGYATLQLGAEKLTLEDGQEVTSGVSDTSVTGARVYIASSQTNKIEAINSIYIYVNPNSDFKALAEGKDFVDPVFGTFSVRYADTTNGLLDPSRDAITVAASGSTRAYVKLTALGGDEQTLFFDYNGALAYDINRNINVVEGAQAQQDQYVYLTPATATSTTEDAAKYTHLVRVKNIKQHNTQGSATFEDALTLTEYKSTEGQFNDTLVNRTLTVDGFQYNVHLTDTTSGAENVTVTYAGTSPATVIFPATTLKNGETFALLQNVTGLSIPNGATIVTPTGSFVYSNLTTQYQPSGSALVYHTASTGGAAMASIAVENASNVPTVLIKEEKDNANPQAENVVRIPTTYTASPGEGVNVGTPIFSNANAGTNGYSMQDDKTTAYVDVYGTYVTKYAPTGNNAVQVKVWYPDTQMYANVFIAPIGAIATSTSTSGAVSLNPISVGMAIFDSDVTTLDGTNKPYIVVGGPCINTVAATLLGASKDTCTQGFTEGKAMIKLFADKNALLVAGFSGKDTLGACDILATYADHNFSGTELEVTTTNLNSLSVKTISN
jgi:hypothetical protein